MDRFKLANMTAEPMAGRGVDESGRHYWRIRGPSPERLTLWAGWATRLQVEIEIGALAVDPSRRDRRDLSAGAGPCRTVGDILQRWAGWQRKRRDAGEIAAHTLRGYTYSIGYWLAAPLAEITPRRLTRDRVQDQATAWLAAGVAPRTIDVAVGVLAQAIRWAADRELGPDVDVAIRRLAREDEHVYCGSTPARWEVDRMLAAIPPGPDRVAIELLALTGARISEILALRVGDVDVRARRVRVSGRDDDRELRGKTGVRVLPARGRLLEVLEDVVADRPAEDRLVERAPAWLRRVMVAACASAGVDRITPHGLRRLVVSELLEHGDAKHVAAWTGHSLRTMLGSYVRPTEGTLEALATRAGLGERGKVIELPGTDRGHKGRG